MQKTVNVASSKLGAIAQRIAPHGEHSDFCNPNYLNAHETRQRNNKTENSTSSMRRNTLRYWRPTKRLRLTEFIDFWKEV
jgi:hypothetical protein